MMAATRAVVWRGKLAVARVYAASGPRRNDANDLGTIFVLANGVCHQKDHATTNRPESLPA